MPTDNAIFILRHTEYRNIISDARAAEVIARELGLSYDSVRGRLSRADVPSARLWLAEQIAKNPPTVSPSVSRQTLVFEKSYSQLESVKTSIRSRGNKAVMVGLYDIHYPHTRFDAVALALQILEDVRPNYVVYGGDVNDNEGFSRWPDERSPYDRLFSADYANNSAGEYSLRQAVYKASPNSLALDLTGNHCLWRYNFMRREDPMQAEERIAQYVEGLYNHGNLIFSTTREEKIDLHDNLDVWHGQFTSPNHMTNAKNTIGQFMQYGRAKSIVVGHTHRPIHIPGSAVGYSGVNYYNAPCLSRVESIPWLNRDPRAWGLGVPVVYMDRDGEEGYIVNFKPKGNKLVAEHKGRHYETELKE